MIDWDGARRALAEAPALGVAPRLDAAVWVDGETHVLSSHPDLPEARFDLASLTKPLASGLIALSLVAQGRAELDAPIGLGGGPGGGAGGFTLRQLLEHRAGFAAWAPLFLPLAQRPETAALFSADRPRDARALFRASRARMEAAVEALSPVRPAGEATEYSDLGILRLQRWLERLTGDGFGSLFETHARAPLGLDVGFNDLCTHEAAPAEPTGHRRPRPPAPGQEAHVPRGVLREVGPRPGEVDDDNAYALGGVAGHAGLFGTARAVALVGEAFLGECDGARQIAPPELALAFCGARDAVRGLGWDRPTPGGSVGAHLGQGARGAVGHLGFTGCSLWIDLDRRASIVLCSNRVRLGRENQLLRDFRPRFHDLVAQALGLT